MRILYVIDTLVTGGTEKSLLHITSRFKEEEPIIVTLFDKKHDLIEDFRSAGVSVIELGIKPGDKFWLPKAVRKLNKLFAQLRPAIVHAHLYNGELACRLASKKYGHILLGSFVNDSYVEERFSNESAVQNFKIKMYRTLDRLTAKRVSAFTSLTKSIARTNAAALGIPEGKIKVIPRGRPVHHFSVNHPPLSEPFVFVCVARLLKRKGYFDLLDALKILKQNNKNCKVIAAGNGVDADSIKQYVRNCGVEDSIEFIGNSNNIPQLLSSSHAFVLPSHYEGMGASLMEAMLAAKPIVASDIDVFKEQITHKDTGLIFEVMNASDLADKMSWVMNNYYQAIEMGLKAREFAIENFDIEKVAGRYEEYYQRLVMQKQLVEPAKHTVIA